MRKVWSMVAIALLAMTAVAVELKNGAEFTLNDAPEELSVKLKRGGAVRFLLEENATTGYRWEATYASNECSVVIEHRGADAAKGLCGAPGKASFTVTKNAAVQSPSLVEFAYRRSWEKNVKPAKTVRLVLYTIPGEAVDFRYPASRTLHMLKAECRNRGIELIDWHVHIRGGLTPEMAAEREKASGIRQSAMENHGREWEIFDNARLVAFAEKARAAKANGHALPVGIQVNDRDWFRQIDAATRAQFDYILADTMIMGKLPNGRDKRLWLVKDLAEIGDPEKWMDEYVAMNLQILGEPISILANPGYLPAPLDGMHDRLWTDERMRKVIGKAVERGIAIEIQAESPYPSPRFLRLAKAMGAKFSFGTNNYDAAPKDLSRWLEAIVWLDLHGPDIWTPKALKGESAQHGILCLTFDDPHWDRWVAALPLFTRYGARVSFFPNGPLDDHALECLKKLHDAGHTVGPHTLHHASAPEYFAAHGGEAYWQEELKPQMDAFARVGIVPRAMAYPNNRHTPETDAFLREKGFRRFRCGVPKKGYAPQKFALRFADVDWAYRPAAEFAGLVAAEGFGVGEYYQTDIDDLLLGLERAAKRNEVMVIYSHDISERATSVNMKTAWLEKILKRANELGMSFRTLED